MKIKVFFITIFSLILSYWGLVIYNSQPRQKNFEAKVNHILIQLSESLLMQVKVQKETQAIEKELVIFPLSELEKGLPDDNAKKTFWINIYNAYYQLLYTREKKENPEIFTEKLITIANTSFSLDDIEHGILRKYRWKYSLGYLENIFTSSFIKGLAVDTIDYRIHFALNCGAKSCPPIAFYQYEKIDEQLDKASRSFLLSETEIDDTNKTLTTSMILSWFRGDFGGKKGIKTILGKLFNKNLADYSVDFKAYNWEEAMENFVER